MIKLWVQTNPEFIGTFNRDPSSTLNISGGISILFDFEQTGQTTCNFRISFQLLSYELVT